MARRKLSDDQLRQHIRALSAHSPASPLEQLHTAAVISQAAADTQAHHVALCRMNGATWEAIAHAIGVSRQAAHERYGPGREAAS